jgi:hypothetical protein
LEGLPYHIWIFFCHLKWVFHGFSFRSLVWEISSIKETYVSKKILTHPWDLTNIFSLSMPPQSRYLNGGKGLFDISNQRTKWKSVKYPFEMTKIYLKWSIVDPLKIPIYSIVVSQSLLYMQPQCVETCATSNDHIWQTKKRNEIPWNSHLRWQKKIQMWYGRPSKMSYRVGMIYLKFSKCRGSQMMLRVCRVAWAIVEVVRPLWATCTLCKIAKNVANQ